MDNRYARQRVLKYIGKEGQEKLGASRAAIVGMGALGSVQANLLARAGVGYLRLIDRDTVELNNLQRQVLYTEKDAEESVPKAFAAAERLRQVNSAIEIEEVITDLNSGNAEALLSDVDVVLDATDNMETRDLINEVCVKHGIPWVYGGALETEGMTMSILPEGPCFACMTGRNTHGGAAETRTCSNVGVLNGLTSVVASIQATEAMKILIGSPDVRKTLLYVDMWNNEMRELPLEKNPRCPVCGRGEYWYLNHSAGIRATGFCGKDAVQIVPENAAKPDLQKMKEKLEALGTVKLTRFCLDFEGPEASFQIYPDGRAVIRKVNSEGKAKSVYAEYIGF